MKIVYEKSKVINVVFAVIYKIKIFIQVKMWHQDLDKSAEQIYKLLNEQISRFLIPLTKFLYRFSRHFVSYFFFM